MEYTAPSPTTASNREVRFSSSAKTATPCPEHLHVFLLPLRPFPWQRSLEGKVRIISVYIVSSAGSCKVINFPMMQLENSDFAGLAICSTRSAGSPRLDSRRARPGVGSGRASPSKPRPRLAGPTVHSLSAASINFKVSIRESARKLASSGVRASRAPPGPAPRPLSRVSAITRGSLGADRRPGPPHGTEANEIRAQTAAPKRPETRVARASR